MTMAKILELLLNLFSQINQFSVDFVSKKYQSQGTQFLDVVFSMLVFQGKDYNYVNSRLNLSFRH